MTLKADATDPLRVAVFGLWHLGSVTAACLAAAGHQVTGLDLDARVVGGLRDGHAPLHEPGLDALITQGLESGRLTITTNPGVALADVDVLWVTLDTPVDDDDQADVGWVRAQLDRVADSLSPGTLVLLSTQLPAGFGRVLGDSWAQRGVTVGCSPENLRLGRAVEAFCNQERIVVGLDREDDRERVEALMAPFTDSVLWMSLESAEMSKHALNAFLATSVAFANELARLCELTGADAKEVESSLKSEARIGPRAYLSPGAAFAGGTLARDVRFLQGFGDTAGTDTPLLDGVVASNELHRGWTRAHLERLLSRKCDGPVAILGLTYKPGTSTLRRSSAVSLCRWLVERGAAVQAFDPAAQDTDGTLPASLTRTPSARDAVRGARVAVIATPWPEFRELTPDDLASTMLEPVVIDEGWSLSRLAGDPRITYLAPGRPRRR
jgi:UDPglucose 6-dehydrogenase